MDQLRFEAALGTYTVSVAPESIWIFKGMGTHYFQLQLEVGIPQVGAEAGRLLCLETTLYAPQQTGPRAPLDSANVSVPFNATGEVRRPTLQYLITNAQLLALEQHRAGDLRLELQVRGFLPQSSGFPGASEITEHLSIAESRWRQQLAGLGRTLGAEMLIPFPADDEPRRVIADFLREAQRLLGGSEIDSAMLQVRKALETIRKTSGWNWPGKKDKGDTTADERWALIRSAMEDQASGAMHVDPGTKDYKYSRAEVETLIAMTGALLRVMA
ncbi:hypothetical protein [Asanoa siamensis]|uniref:ApeA N-terminal domain-containing protein n=1 Tax=Asanoa siamensis TaxID=926357 RepID=A0ABQ4CWU6_9ACTN|nr:hypothetical protein [Asanoa siamensis]GIF75753.1 hypothetical protein Asi02nite_52710 [Asanoa siamensis]